MKEIFKIHTYLNHRISISKDCLMENVDMKYCTDLQFRLHITRTTLTL